MVDKYTKWIPEDESYVMETVKKTKPTKKQPAPVPCQTTTSLRNLSID